MGDGERIGRIPEVDLPVGLEVRGRLAVGHDEEYRLRGGVATEVTIGEQQGVMQVGALVVCRVEAGELLDIEHLGVAPEPDEL